MIYGFLIELDQEVKTSVYEKLANEKVCVQLAKKRETTQF